MACVTSVSFENLNNDVAFGFFRFSRELRQSFPIPPYIFIHVEKGFRKALVDAKRRIIVQGIRVGMHERFTHVLFVDDVFLLCFGSD